MKILLIYCMSEPRKTILDSIFCFGKYQHKHEMFYYCYNSAVNILPIMKTQNFDMVLFHNTFMCIKWTPGNMVKVINEFSGLWKNSSKAVILQDEYLANNLMVDFINKVDIDIIFSLAKKEIAEKLYPEEKVGKRKIVKILTGYVDRDTVNKLQKMQKKIVGCRDIDIGFRACKVNFSLGEIGLLKSQIPEKFNDFVKDYPNITVDIKNTNYNRISNDNKNLLLGNDWIKFLLRCRTMVGCLGGSSILDPDGKLYYKYRRLVDKRYTSKYYERLRAEIEEKYDTNLNYTAISPRCFECAITKTCQLLVEGDYEGIMLPGVHYIEIKRDFSNLKEVMEKVMDKEYCERIAQNAYKDLVESGKYDYSQYVKLVLRHMELKTKGKNKCVNNGLFVRALLLFNDIVCFIKVRKTMKVKQIMYVLKEKVEK